MKEDIHYEFFNIKNGEVRRYVTAWEFKDSIMIGIYLNENKEVRRLNIAKKRINHFIEKGEKIYDANSPNNKRTWAPGIIEDYLKSNK